MGKHIPVLLKEVVRLFRCRPTGMYVDCTLGAGGHAEAILEQLGKEGILIGIDRDGEAIKVAAERFKKYGFSCRLVQDNFKNLTAILKSFNLQEVDGIFFDLGVSSSQLDNPERGFSFRFDALLDMRADRRASLTASHLVNNSSQEDLERILRDFGEERWARRIAKLIVARRKNKPIKTTAQLVGIVEEALPYKRGKIHPATRTFQALRIAVNGELEALREGLEEGIKLLRPGGRMGVISYHSLEDRIVKGTFQEWAKACHCPPRWPLCCCGGKKVALRVTKGVLKPGEEEILANPRSRSARLRVAEKI